MSFTNNNLKLDQLKFSIDEKLISKDNNCNWIFQKLGSINDKVAATAYLESNYRDLIGCSALHFALGNKDLEAFESLLKHGADFTAKNQIGSTTLHSAIEQLFSGNPSNIQECKTKFEDKFASAILTASMNCKNFDNPSDRNGFSHFHAACMMNFIESVQFYISNGVYIHDAVNSDSPYFPGYTPLHFAVKFFALETVEILLKHGVNRNLKDTQRLKPLHVLLETSIKYVKSVGDNKDVSVTEFIKKVGKIVSLFIDNDNDDMMVIDEYGFSQFHLICITQDLPSIEQYTNKVVNIDHAVNTDSPLCPGYTGLHFTALFSFDTVKALTEKGADLGVKDAKGVTPFDLCLEMYNVEEIHAILSLHPVWRDIVFSNKKSKSSRTSIRCNTKLLDFVLALKNQDEFIEFVRKVMKKANLFISLTSSLWPGYTPLHVAVSLLKNCDKGRKDMFRELREQGADVNAQDARGRTALNLAFRLGKDKIVDTLMLLCWSETVNNVDEDGLSDMHIFCANPTIASDPPISNLLKEDVNVNMTYTGESPVLCVIPGSTPLHMTITTPYHGYYKIYETPKLVEHGADVNAKDSNGMTPIHLAFTCKGQARKLVEILMSSSLLKDVVAEDIQLSHLHAACFANLEAKVVEKLIELGADVNKAIVRRTSDNIDSCFDRFVGWTPLYFATLHRNRQMMELLVQRGADILAGNSRSKSPLYTSLEFTEIDLDLFTTVLKGNVDMQRRMEDDVGLTMLHVACRLVDVNLVKDLLAKGANVDAQVRSDSPIWPGFAPLHVWASFLKQPKDEDEDNEDSLCEDVLKLLLEKNADVTLGDAAGDTPLHIICKNWKNISVSGTIGCCTFRLLQAHPNFRVNPVNAKGISLFHLACMLGELDIVEKFLNHGKVDVNKAIDPFFKTLAGCTPLHLAIRHVYLRSNMFSHFDMIDLLLRHGANVHAEDSYGNTPIHDAVKYHSMFEYLFERLVREGADFNGHNVKGETPLELLLKKAGVSIEKVRYLLKCGCRLNATNPLTDRSYLALAFSSMTLAAFQDLIFKTSMNFPDSTKPDEQGRKMIHNVVSGTVFDTITYHYRELIQKVLRMNDDVDDQDKLGRTPLHFAAKYFNYSAVSELLNAGSDINVLDLRVQSALTIVSNARPKPTAKISEKMKILHGLTVQKLVVHAKKLLFCGLYVSPINQKVLTEECDQSIDNPREEELFGEQLVEIKNVKISSSYSLSLGDFLSELGAVADYPTMSQIKRDAIDEFFMSIDHNFLEKYDKVVGLLRLQYRKALARVELVERANESLIVVAGFRLPDVCSQIVLKLLTNSDLENLIVSTFENE